MTRSSFTRTYEIDEAPTLAGAGLTPAQRSGLTRRLRADAKAENLSLGETEIVSHTVELGVRQLAHLRAPVVGPYGIGAPEPDDDGIGEAPLDAAESILDDEGDGSAEE